MVKYRFQTVKMAVRYSGLPCRWESDDRLDNKPLILVVEDDKPIRNFIAISLKAQGYGCIEAQSGQTAITMVASYNPDIIVLDLGLSDIDGLEVIQKVRQWSHVAIIVVSARYQDREKAEALDLGADDYLTKPFSVSELLARIKVALRHLQQNRDTDSILQKDYIIEDLKIDFIKRRIFVKDEEIHLTPLEYNLIALMVKYAGRVLTHHFILKEIWGTYSGKDTQSLRVFMANIRRKIEKNPAQPRYIITEVGVGYRLADE